MTNPNKWYKGPNGPASLCGKCGWQYYISQRKLRESGGVSAETVLTNGGAASLPPLSKKLKAEKSTNPREQEQTHEEMQEEEEEEEEDQRVVIRCFCPQHCDVALSPPWRRVHTQLQQRTVGAMGIKSEKKKPDRKSDALQQQPALPSSSTAAVAADAPTSETISHSYGSARCIPLASTLR